MSMSPEQLHAAQLEAASKGFDFLFSDKIEEAIQVFSADESPFHLAGMGVCTFLEAALGLEVWILVANLCDAHFSLS